MDITPCSLGPIDWVRPFLTPMRRTAGCACGIGFQAPDDAGIRKQYARHLTIARPPAQVLARDIPTIADIDRWPDFFIGGPGSRPARDALCPHGGRLLSLYTCPGCAEDRAAAEPTTEPSHHCESCGEDSWSTVSGDSITCPHCGDEAAEIRYCAFCERPNCRIECHEGRA